MKKEQAQELFHNILTAPAKDIGERSKNLANSPYPELDTYYWEYMYGTITLQEFESKCVKYIQLSDTKLFQILK